MSEIQEENINDEKHIIEEHGGNSDCSKVKDGTDKAEFREKLRFSIDSILQDRMKAIMSSTTEHDVDTNVSSYSEGDSLQTEMTLDKTEQIADSEKVSHVNDLTGTHARWALMHLSPVSFTTYLDSLANYPHTRAPAAFPASHSVGLAPAGWVVPDIRRERFGLSRRVGHPYQNRTPPKRKKPRTSFTRLQIIELEKRFERQKYLASTERSLLATTLKMTDAQIKTWFQNRRTKWRRQTAEEREIERQAANRLMLNLRTSAATQVKPLTLARQMCLNPMAR
ncbi:hypothetical protein ACJMK2_006816 [Sinanodonta woodiana]|uniref:Homeobox domain-containing protein n=1 Tax=Sinanodonta woodiana TaxID=1069815 RepID=A0ABD3VV22_SINWO